MIAYLYTIYTFVLIIASKHHINQIKKGDVTRRWKKYEWINRVLVIVLMFVAGGCKHWQDYLLSGTINMLIFELGMNVALKSKSIWAVGTTSEIEKGLGKYFKIIICILVAISLTLKIIIK